MIKNFFVAYLLSLLHEGCHFLTAKSLSLETKGILLRPWGSALKLSHILSPYDEFCVAMAGPLFHLVLVPFSLGNEFFFFPNMAMLLANILPALPLDGGRMFRAVLLSFLPLKKAERYSRASTLFCILFLYALSFFMTVWMGKIPPIFFLPVFLSFAWNENEEEKILLMHRALFGKKEKVGNMYVISEKKRARDLRGELFLERENVFFLSNKMGIYGILSEKSLYEEAESTVEKIFVNMVEKKREIG